MMNQYLYKYGLLACLTIASGVAKAQGAGSIETLGGTAGLSALTMHPNDTTVSVAETLYIGAGNYQVDGFWKIYSKNIWLSPNAVITGAGSIRFFNTADAGGASSATLIDGNNNAGYVNVNVGMYNAGNMLLTDFAGPGGSWTDVAGNANLTVGKDFNFAVANANVLLGNYDMIVAATGTLSNYQPDRFVVTNGTGHLVHENYTGAFTYPVGMVQGDYTPAIVNNSGTNTIHVNVTDYAGDVPVEVRTDGIDRTWNIYGNNSGGATISLQHNTATNQGQFSSTANFVTQYGPSPNHSGDQNSTSRWQENTPGPSTINGTTETQSRAYAALATTASADESSFTKASDLVNPLPLTLLSFDGKRNGTDDLLYWAAASEQNIDHYELAYSTNALVFNTIAQTKATGNNSKLTQNYQYTQTDVNGDAWFRLKIVELSGNYRYSNVVKISGDSKAANGCLINNGTFPVPFANELYVNINSCRVQPATVALYTADGKQVAMEEYVLQTNSNIYTLHNLNKLSRGIYILRIQTQDDLINIKATR